MTYLHMKNGTKKKFLCMVLEIFQQNMFSSYHFVYCTSLNCMCFLTIKYLRTTWLIQITACSAFTNRTLPVVQWASWVYLSRKFSLFLMIYSMHIFDSLPLHNRIVSTSSLSVLTWVKGGETSYCNNLTCDLSLWATCQIFKTWKTAFESPFSYYHYIKTVKGFRSQRVLRASSISLLKSRKKNAWCLTVHALNGEIVTSNSFRLGIRSFLYLFFITISWLTPQPFFFFSFFNYCTLRKSFLNFKFKTLRK